MSNIAFIGLPNWTKENFVVISTTGASNLVPSGMEAAYLKTEEPSELSRLASLDPQHTQWSFDTSGVALTIDGIGVVNHNIAGDGQIRFMANTNGGSVISPSIARPNSITPVDNVTGAYTDIDEDIYTPDGSVLSPTNTALIMSVYVDFETPTATLKGGDDLLCFVIVAKRVYTGAGATSPTTIPKLTCYLQEGGSAIRNMGTRAISSTSNQIFIFPFSKSELGTATGAAIQAGIFVSPGTSASGASHGVVDTVALYYERTVVSGFDSGWLTIPADEYPSPIRPVQHIQYIPDTPWENVLGYNVLIRSDQAIHDPLSTNMGGEIPVGVIPKNPDQFVQVGVAPAGIGIYPANDAQFVGIPPTRLLIQEVRADGWAGQTYGYDAWKRIETDVIELLVTRVELLSLQDQLPWRRGYSGAFLVAINPSDPLAEQTFTSFWCTLLEMSAPTWAGTISGTDHYTVTIRLVQKL